MNDGADWWQQQQLLERQRYETEEGAHMLLRDTGGGDFEQPPVGTHIARCVRVIDIGTQKNDYQGTVTSKRQCIITWELPTELMTDGNAAGKPFIVSRFYTASLSEKANLRKDLANWRGRDFTETELQGFDAQNILDKTCLIALTPNEKGRVRVTGVMALPKGTPTPPRVNPLVYFSLDEFDEAAFNALSDGIRKMIVKSPEYQAIRNPGSRPIADDAPGPFDDMTDDIPFANPYRGIWSLVV